MLAKGVNSQGIDLESIGGSYAPLTIILKQEKGLPFDRVTLFDTGEFYNSFSVTAEKDGFVIFADTIKENNDLRKRWGPDILGLTDESIAELSEQLIEKFSMLIKQKLLS